MSEMPIFYLPVFNVTLVEQRVAITMISNHGIYTMVVSGEVAAQLRDDLISACQSLANVPPLTITQRHNPDGSITTLYGWRREEDTP